MSEDQEIRKVKRLCKGNYKDDKGKVQQAWFTLNDDGETNFESWTWFTGKRIAGAVPGAVYEWNVLPNGNTWLSGTKAPVYVEMWKDQVKVAELQATSRAVDAAHKFELKAKKEQSVDYVEKSLEPILLAMRKAKSPAERAAIKLMVMERLERWHK